MTEIQNADQPAYGTPQDQPAEQPAAVTDEPQGVVTLTKYDGEVLTVDYRPEASLTDYLRQNGVQMVEGQLPEGSGVTVNGRAVRDLSEPIPADSVVVVTSKIGNG